jgi:hypothetical protein
MKLQKNIHDPIGSMNLQKISTKIRSIIAQLEELEIDLVNGDAETLSSATTLIDAVQTNLTNLVSYAGSRIKEFRYKGSLADDATYTLPFELVSPGGWGMAFCGNTEYSMFCVSGAGVVTLFNTTSNVVANADTDTNFCIGTAASQDPLIFKNRLGSSQNLFVVMWYA